MEDIVTFFGDSGNLRASVFFNEQLEEPFQVKFYIHEEHITTLFYKTEQSAASAAMQFTL